ncbi:hypothetical protein [Streptomyces radicis]|uniref:hypothetical protein n=1 Tax=Streptomyces radicis TaxID=1750517 RepID=UPI0011C3869D|nr:hypothetical protein [Streptomyces radicis]
MAAADRRPRQGGRGAAGARYIALTTVIDDICVPPGDLVTGRFRGYGRSLRDLVDAMHDERWARAVAPTARGWRAPGSPGRAPGANGTRAPERHRGGDPRCRGGLGGRAQRTETSL